MRCFCVAAAALQAWLEAAWQAGFDPGGAAMLGAAVQCTRKWIGTTEAAAMLRYFGCRALIVDFFGECWRLLSSGTHARAWLVVAGPACTGETQRASFSSQITL